MDNVGGADIKTWLSGLLMKFLTLCRAATRNDSNRSKTEKGANAAVLEVVLAGEIPSKTILFINFINEIS
ncbi:MAG: hypothetical protein NMNS02_22600 [Nitrosomonas sp.]|nr:MAG: hypothetical protein NMNS02_22600 [Nitrosomonas sp.]